MTFSVYVQSSDVSQTGYPDLVAAEERTFGKAVDKAKEAACALKRQGATAIVGKDGTNEVWSVQYHPEAPVASGEVDESGIPMFKFPVEFRIVHDGREMQYSDPDDEGNFTETGLAGPHEVADFDA